MQHCRASAAKNKNKYIYFKTLGKIILSSVPHLPSTGNLAKGSTEFSQTSPVPKSFSKQCETRFFKMNRLRKKKKIPDGFPCYSSNFPGRWEKHTDIHTAALVTNKSQRSPCLKILSKWPHTVLNLPSQFLVCLFVFSPSRRGSKWFHTFLFSC